MCEGESEGGRGREEVNWEQGLERGQFNAVIKSLIAPWEMCFGLGPGLLSFVAILFYTHTHTRTVPTNRNLM